VLVFDVVNAITIQGLETIYRPTDSFALLVLSILALLLFSSGCPVLSCGCHAVSCAVLRYLDRPVTDRQTDIHATYGLSHTLTSLRVTKINKTIQCLFVY